MFLFINRRENQMNQEDEKEIQYGQKRVYGNKIEIDQAEIKKLYAKRSGKSKTVHVDSPTVLSSDANIENIELWTKEELERWFPLFQLNEDSVVFELGFGTGRMTRFITPMAKQYIGIDYVKEFADIIIDRKDIIRKDNTQFLTMSFEEFLEKGKELQLPQFNRFFLSGGVFMYINDEILYKCLEQLEERLAEHCVIYISEPIAMEERLTLNAFYSDTIEDNYSAIYRTEQEYQEIFEVFYRKGFRLKASESLFKEDIKKQKETKQWIYILER